MRSEYWNFLLKGPQQGAAPAAMARFPAQNSTVDSPTAMDSWNRKSYWDPVRQCSAPEPL
jgi:hypothetical protein